MGMSVSRLQTAVEMRVGSVDSWPGGHGGVARKLEAETLSEHYKGPYPVVIIALQRAISSSNPLVVRHTIARHVDGQLGGLGIEHVVLEEDDHS
jgi:hypothetical protein